MIKFNFNVPYKKSQAHLFVSHFCLFELFPPCCVSLYMSHCPPSSQAVCLLVLEAHYCMIFFVISHEIIKWPQTTLLLSAGHFFCSAHMFVSCYSSGNLSVSEHRWCSDKSVSPSFLILCFFLMWFQPEEATTSDLGALNGSKEPKHTSLKVVYSRNVRGDKNN